MHLEVHRIDPTRRNDFYRVHSAINDAACCFCVAWWVPTWDGWSDRPPIRNRAFRDKLFDRGEYDGYLLYDDGKPVGWCQVGPRDRLEKLVAQFNLSPDPQSWAITCFLIAPAYRRQGYASFMLDEILTDLKARGVKRIEAFPKRGQDLSEGDMWTGPESTYLKAGFKLVSDNPEKPMLALVL